MKRFSVFSIVALVVAVALYVVPISLSWMPYKFMDLNDNGVVGYGEVFFSIDLGVRNDAESGCVEIFYLKDGRGMKLICAG